MQSASIRDLSVGAIRCLVLVFGTWVLSAWFTWWVAHEDITTDAAAAIYVVVAPVLLLTSALGGPTRGMWAATAVLTMVVGPMAMVLFTLRSILQAAGFGLALLPPVAALHVALSKRSPLARRFCVAAMLVFVSSWTSLPYRVWPWTEIRRQAAAALVEHQRARASMGLPPTGPLTAAQWTTFRARPGRWPVHFHPMFGLPYALDAQDDTTALLGYGDGRTSRMNAPDFLGPYDTYD